MRATASVPKGRQGPLPGGSCVHSMATASYDDSVFINCPFDPEYQEIFVHWSSPCTTAAFWRAAPWRWTMEARCASPRSTASFANAATAFTTSHAPISTGQQTSSADRARALPGCAGFCSALQLSSMRRLPAGLFAFVALALSACDPSYCATVHGDVRMAGGQPAPAGTPVVFYMGAPPRGGSPDSTYAGLPIDSTTTRADGKYERKLHSFLIDLSSVGILTLGKDTVARIRSSTRCGRPPRTRVDLVGVAPA